MQSVVFLSLVILLLVISFILVTTVSYMVYKMSAFPKEYDSEKYKNDKANQDFGVHRLFEDDIVYETKNLKTKTGLDLNLKMYYKPNQDSQMPNKIYLFHHGVRTGYETSYKYFTKLVDMGYLCISYNSRGWRDSKQGNAHTTYSHLEKSDLNDVINFITKNIKHESLILHGESMGSMAVINYLLTYGSSKVDKVVSDGTVINLEEAIYYNAKQLVPNLPNWAIKVARFWFVRKDKYNPKDLDFADKIVELKDIKMFFIHTKTDQVVPYSSFEKIKVHENSNSNFIFSSYESGKHVLEVQEDPTRYWDELKNFLNEV